MHLLGTQNIWLFIISGLMLNISPGPDSLLIMSRSAADGWRAGVVATWGIGSGVCVHVLAAALGLSALLMTSSVAFTVVKVAGAAYLVWIGIGMMHTRNTPGCNVESSNDAPEATQSSGTRPISTAMSYRAIYLQGFLTNVLNPKVALFFLAFVPQFIAPEARSKPLAFLFLGAVFNINGMLWCHSLAIFSASISRRVVSGLRLTRWLNRTMGGVFIALGVRLALASR